MIEGVMVSFVVDESLCKALTSLDIAAMGDGEDVAKGAIVREL